MFHMKHLAVPASGVVAGPVTYGGLAVGAARSACGATHHHAYGWETSLSGGAGAVPPNVFSWFLWIGGIWGMWRLGRREIGRGQRGGLGARGWRWEER